MAEWTRVSGTLKAGYRVASGPSRDYPYGALERQKPLFRQRGLDLQEYFEGTLNIDIRPYRFRMVEPQFTFRQVAWTDLHPPEDFSFSACLVSYQSNEFRGWIYYPHPETKLRNFQDPTLLEVIAQHIPGIGYGDRLEILINPAELVIERQTEQDE
jgi:hypothetical protein